MNYLEPVREINEHNSARAVLAASAIQANCSNHIDPTALDEIGTGSKFKDLKTLLDDVLLNFKL
jgi:hypothetical protein